MPGNRPPKGERDSSSALTRALRFEKAGKRFFLMSAARSADPYAKEVFLLLAGLEDRHMQDIRAISARLEESGKFPAVSSAPSEERMRIFAKALRQVRKQKMITGGAADAMRKALAFEAEGREMYLRMAKGAVHPQEKKFFNLLSAEEQSHFNVVYEYLDYLEASGLRMGE
ncbi:MAG: ferritin family protein [Deltaproteobacteria bacterium]|nr:ferritin family protein [Deltaproteobacteria bacterium]